MEVPIRCRWASMALVFCAATATAVREQMLTTLA